MLDLGFKNCKPVHGSNCIIEFAENTKVIILIRDDDTAYREKVQHFAVWCTIINLLLNTSKTKELTVNFRRKTEDMHNTIHINGMAVECVSSFKFLGVYQHLQSVILRTLKKNHLSPVILVILYQC